MDDAHIRKEVSMKAKRILLVVYWIIFIGIALASPSHTVLLTEGFDSQVMPPEGWSVDSHQANWRLSFSRYSRGTIPELWFDSSPSFQGNSYFISPMVDTTDMTQLIFHFKHFMDPRLESEEARVGVATRSAEGEWHEVWTMYLFPDLPAQSESILITNEDVGSDQFQIALFVSGYCPSIRAWLADDLILWHLHDYDLVIVESNLPSQIAAFEPFAPSCVVKNKGIEALTPIVELDIYEGDLLVDEYVFTATTALSLDGEIIVEFPAFYPSFADEIYRFVLRARSVEAVVDQASDNNVIQKWVSTWTHPKQKVLLEICSGIWTPFGPGTSLAAADLLDMDASVAILGNHYYDSYANTSSVSRKVLYDVRSFPTSLFDGLCRHVGGSFGNSIIDDYLPLYEQRIPYKSPGDILIYGREIEEQYELTVRIDKRVRRAQPNLHLYLAITESGIPQIWQGQTVLNFVNRGMYPSHVGLPIEMFNNEEGMYDHDISFAWNPAWNPDNCEIIAFIQDDVTMEVIQANSIALVDLVEAPLTTVDNVLPIARSALVSTYPNPFNPQTTIIYSIPSPQKVTLNVYNLKGQLIRTLVDEELKSGQHNVTWYGEDHRGTKVSSGMYLIRMESKSGNATRKILLCK